MPASTPTAVSNGGRTSIGHSTRIETNQRPAVSRLTVTVDGSAPSGSGRNQRMSGGASMFGEGDQADPVAESGRYASRYGDDRDFRIDLNDGIRGACPKFAIASWRR